MSLALGDFGTVARERLQVVVVIVAMIALGLAERAAKRAEPEHLLAEPYMKQLSTSG